MLRCYSLVNDFKLFILVFVFVIKCDGCPLLQTLTFGSDIEIKCNSTSLKIYEKNNKPLNWKFIDKNFACQQNGILQASVNQCNIIPIGSDYLKVQLKSLYRNEHACVYCPINYKPIAPIIHVTKSNDQGYIFYEFNLTATGLKPGESFEILWAKRVHHRLSHSINYWFLHECIHRDIEGFERINQSIIFAFDDQYISRVEFIIRRCKGNCLIYKKCDDQQFAIEASEKHFQIPDSIEKISCDEDCLDGILPPTTILTTTTTTTMSTTIKEYLYSSTIQLSTRKATIKYFILFPILAFIIVLAFTLLLCFIITRIKGLHSENTYVKTSNINLDDNKETNN